MGVVDNLVASIESVTDKPPLHLGSLSGYFLNTIGLLQLLQRL